MPLKEKISAIALIVLFSLAMLMFMVNFLSLNNPSSDLIDNSYVNSSIVSLTNYSNEIKSTAEDASSTLSQDEPSAIYIFLIIKSAFSISLSFLGFLITGAGLIITMIFTLLFGVGLGQYAVVLGVISGLIILGIVITVLEAIRSGRLQK